MRNLPNQDCSHKRVFVCSLENHSSKTSRLLHTEQSQGSSCDMCLLLGTMAQCRRHMRPTQGYQSTCAWWYTQLQHRSSSSGRHHCTLQSLACKWPRTTLRLSNSPVAVGVLATASVGPVLNLLELGSTPIYSWTEPNTVKHILWPRKEAKDVG